MAVTVQKAAQEHSAWKFLAARGWKIELDRKRRVRGTAAADASSKTILITRSLLGLLDVRERRYVIPHEIWHAVHYEVTHFATPFPESWDLSFQSRREVVADGCCWYGERTNRMRKWLAASVKWHAKIGQPYSLLTVTSRPVQDFAEKLAHAASGR